MDNDDHSTRNRIIIIVGVVIAVGIIVGFAFASVKYVPYGNVGVKTVWGAIAKDADGNYLRALDAGQHFVSPISEDIVLVNIQTQANNYDVAGASRDAQDVNAIVTLSWHVDPSNAARVLDETQLSVGDRLFNPAIQGLSKTVMPTYDAIEIIQQRALLVADIREQLSDRLTGRGIIIENIDVTNVDFRQDFKDSIARKVVALQDAETAKNQVLIATEQANQRIAEAEGRKQAAILDAQAVAESINVIDEQLQNSPDYVNYLATQRWDGHLPLVTGGDATPLLNLSDLQRQRQPAQPEPAPTTAQPQ